MELKQAPADSKCPRTGNRHDWAESDPFRYRCKDCDVYMQPLPDETKLPALEQATWPETWMAVAHEIAKKRSYDPRLKVAAIVVPADNTQVLSFGYNGNYRGGPHVHESPEPGKSGFIHAEVNALVKCDYNFPKQKHMYVTHSPCRDCAKLIINAGIVRVVYDVPYRDTSSLRLLQDAGIDVFSLEEAVERARRRV